MNPSETTATQAPEHPHTYWWLVSLACPVIGLVIEALAIPNRSTETLGWVGFVTFALFGLLACLHSFKKKERLRLASLLSGLACGLVLSVFVVALVLSLISGTGAKHF